jgi:hypothetical protein
MNIAVLLSIIGAVLGALVYVIVAFHQELTRIGA